MVMIADVRHVFTVVQNREVALCKQKGAVSLRSGLNMDFKEKAKPQTSSPGIKLFT